MTTYSIYFTNNYSDPGQTQDYAFFCAAPTVTSTAGAVTTYSNVFLTSKLVQGQNWNIDITKTFYGWCGTAPKPLAPGVVVSQGMGKVATLGTDNSSGSTFTVVNSSGAPVFTPNAAFTGAASSYEIDTGTDFTSNLNFLIGMGATDTYGRMKPVATIAAPRNAKTTITPVVKFWLAAYSATVGTAMNTSTISNVAASIDFTANPGMFSAIVSQGNDGAFTVSYAPSAAFAMAVVQNQSSSSGLQLYQLKHQLQLMQSLLDSALGDNEKSDDTAPLTLTTRYKCTLFWTTHRATPTQKRMVLDHLIAEMQGRHYSYSHGSVEGTNLEAYFIHFNPSNLKEAVQDWTDSWFNLASSLKVFVQDPRVEEALDAGDAPTTDDTNGVEQTNGAYADDDLQAKKRRALQFLKAEGLEDFGGALQSA